MDLIKYDMTNIWAVAGDVVAPDDSKIRQGWGVEVVPRQWWNWFENRQDQNIAYMLQKGLPEWDATTEYIINKSYVQRDGIIYRATSTNTNSDPINLTDWVRAFASYSVSSNALGSLTPAADRLPYFNGANTATLTTLSAFARTLLDDTDDTTMRNTISAQQSNANLTSLSGVTPVANGLPYFTGTTSMGIATLTAFGRSVVASADASAARVILGLGTAATLNVGTTANTVMAGDDARVTGSMQRGNNLSDILNVGSARLNLGLGTAATQNVTTTPTDVGGGKLLKVGDFGVGGTSGVSVTDVNTIPATGVYVLQNDTANIPPSTGGGGVVINQVWDTNAAQQILSFSSRLWIRTKSSGSWATWQEVYTTNNSSALASQVQASLQPALDLKVNKAGDTMTGSLTLPSMEVGTSSQPGYIDLHSSGTSSDYDTRIISSGGSSTSGQGSLTYVASGGHYFTGIINGTVTVAQNLTGNIPVGQVTSLQSLLDGKMSTAGGGNPAFVSTRLTSSWAGAGGATQQGLSIGWNSGEASGFSGEANFVCNRGGGTGGFTWRSINSNNTAGGPVTTLSYDGALVVPGRITSAAGVYSGSAFVDTSGNINGTVWNGYLSNYLSANFLTTASLPSGIASLSTGAIGTYAFLRNRSGAAVAPGGTTAGTLNYCNTSGVENGAAGGTWRAMGNGAAGEVTLFLRIA